MRNQIIIVVQKILYCQNTVHDKELEELLDAILKIKKDLYVQVLDFLLIIQTYPGTR
jgi:hypothetical protein